MRKLVLGFMLIMTACLLSRPLLNERAQADPIEAQQNHLNVTASFVGSVLKPLIPENSPLKVGDELLQAQADSVASWLFASEKHDIDAAPLSIQFVVSGNIKLGPKTSPIDELKPIMKDGRRVGLVTWCYVPLTGRPIRVDVLGCATLKKNGDDAEVRTIVKSFEKTQDQWKEVSTK